MKVLPTGRETKSGAHPAPLLHQRHRAFPFHSTNSMIIALTAPAGHEDLVRCVAFSAECALLASGSDDKTVRMWHARTGQLLHLLQGLPRPHPQTRTALVNRSL